MSVCRRDVGIASIIVKCDRTGTGVDTGDLTVNEQITSDTAAS